MAVCVKIGKPCSSGGHKIVFSTGRYIFPSHADKKLHSKRKTLMTQLDVLLKLYSPFRLEGKTNIFGCFVLIFVCLSALEITLHINFLLCLSGTGLCIFRCTLTWTRACRTSWGSCRASYKQKAIVTSNM